MFRHFSWEFSYLLSSAGQESELCKFHTPLRLKWGEAELSQEVVAISEDFTGSEFYVNELKDKMPVMLKCLLHKRMHGKD